MARRRTNNVPYDWNTDGYVRPNIGYVSPKAMDYAGPVEYAPVIGQNWSYGTGNTNIGDSSTVNDTVFNTGKTGRFDFLRNKFAGLNNLSIRNLLKNGVGDPELLGWNSKNGISLLGGNVGNLYTGGKGLVDVFSYLDSANKMSKSKQEGKDIKTDIVASAASNPLASQYLTQDELRTLNQIKRGSYSTEGTGIFDDPGALGMGALKGGLTGLIVGGMPGAIAGAIGSAANAGIKSRRNAQENENAKLESLLQSLNDASAQYKSMRRPNFTGLGIQSRFQDFYR